jgi:UMF1 family MFS transporter
MEKSYRKTVNSWCMYDFANSAFATTIMAAMFPPFYRSLAVQGGMAESAATALWAYTAAAGLLLGALLSPLLGAMADHTGRKKAFTGFFCGLGILCTLGFVFIEKSFLFASLLFIGADIGFACGNIFYESLLPHVALPNDMDRVSARGYAFGYVGGGILLVVNVLMVMRPEWFGIPGAKAAVRLSFFSVALWWGLFSVPFFRNTPEPPRSGAPGGNPLVEGAARLVRTFREIRRYRQLCVFLAAFWIYNDGIGTIIKMATAYGDEIGIGVAHMTAALVLTQFVGVPATFFFGALAKRTGAKRAVLLALLGYTAISVGGFFLRSAFHFYLLAVCVGLVQGGSQALSRSLFGAMVPRRKSAEFFGFFSTSAKMAGIAGPLLFGAVSQAAGSSRLSIVALVVFFLAGGLLLCLVDVEEGARAALENGEQGTRR